MRKLYEIRQDVMDAVASMIYGDEVPVTTSLEDLEIEASEKIRNCFFVINRLKAEQAEADIIIKNAEAYKKARTAAIERIEADVKVTMEVVGLDKIDDPDCRVTLGKASQFVEVLDARLIPDTYCRIVPETKAPDKKAIMDALKAGCPIPGVKIGTGERSLTYPKIKGE